jgi:predicted benzoate:H+ symporter BenE
MPTDLVLISEMSHSQPSKSFAFDPIKTVIGVFVVLGIVLTAVGGYALLQTFGGGLSVIPPELVMTAVFGALLVVTALATRRHVPKRR